jgi:hypothetical protein
VGRANLLSPAVMLATSMQAQPGVCAVLLESGESTGAGISSGWRVVKDLAAACDCTSGIAVARLKRYLPDLENQAAEAEHYHWLSDVDQLRLTIADADRKTEQLQRRISTVSGPLVIARPAPGVQQP